MDGEIKISISSHTGNLVRFEYYNDGSRGLLDRPYRPKWKSAKFMLPSGKKKNETFLEDTTDEQILAAVKKKYSNFKFSIQEYNPIQ